MRRIRDVLIIFHEHAESQRGEEYLRMEFRGSARFGLADQRNWKDINLRSNRQIVRYSLATFEDGFPSQQFSQDTSNRPNIDGRALRKGDPISPGYEMGSRNLT